MEENIDIDKILTPDKEDQAVLILAGKCPHNKGWSYSGSYQSEDVYRCKLCGHAEYY